MLQLLDRLGHQMEEMLLYCRFQGEVCGPRNFSTVSLWTAKHRLVFTSEIRVYFIVKPCGVAVTSFSLLLLINFHNNGV
jgi:hypothetical protein